MLSPELLGLLPSLDLLMLALLLARALL